MKKQKGLNIILNKIQLEAFSAELEYSTLKNHFGCNKSRMKSNSKLMVHLICGAIELTANSLLRLPLRKRTN